MDFFFLDLIAAEIHHNNIEVFLSMWCKGISVFRKIYAHTEHTHTHTLPRKRENISKSIRNERISEKEEKKT